jgi:hypothetical protein
MPRLTNETKEQIKSLTRNELQQIVLKLAAKEKIAYDFIKVNYLDRDYGEQELYDKTKTDLDLLFLKGYRGLSDQLRMANMLSACIKRINEFCKVSNNKKMEADLLTYILREAFSLPDDFFGTCFTKFDSKVAQIVKRLITIVTKKLHEDYKIEYEENINDSLRLLHLRSNHIDFVYNLPKEI